MHSYYDSKLDADVDLIVAGECMAAPEGSIIATLLGSCVAVTLYDSRNKIGGMNHFMLPAPPASADAHRLTTGKYGIHAMIQLINQVIGLGGCEHCLTAKVFGGGHVLGISKDDGKALPDENVRFALSYLRDRNIPVEATHVGGNRGRKIYLDTRSGKVMLKTLMSRTEDRSKPIITRTPQVRCLGTAGY
jgi:chemotaxis protein CheD